MGAPRCGLCEHFSGLAEFGLCKWSDTHGLPFWMHVRTPLWLEVKASEGASCDAFEPREERESHD